MTQLGLDFKPMNGPHAQKARVYHCMSKAYDMHTETIMGALISCGYPKPAPVKVGQYKRIVYFSVCLQVGSSIYDFFSLCQLNPWRDALEARYKGSTTEFSAMYYYSSYLQAQNDSIDRHISVSLIQDLSLLSINWKVCSIKRALMHAKFCVVQVGTEVGELLTKFEGTRAKAVLWVNFHLQTVVRNLLKAGSIPLPNYSLYPHHNK